MSINTGSDEKLVCKLQLMSDLNCLYCLHSSTHACLDVAGFFRIETWEESIDRKSVV